MKIVLANYRYYVSSGPEAYMFNVKRLLEEAGHTVIPFSVRSPLNENTPYSRYFPHGKSDSGDAFFDDVKKTPRNIRRLLSCSFYNREAYKNLRRLIHDETPDVVYVIQQINALSPSIFKAAKDEGVRVVHRLSDFNMMCPRSNFFCDGEICTSCIGGDYSKAREMRCCHGSFVTTEVRIASMKFHRARRLFDCVDAFVCPSGFTAALLAKSGVDKDKINVVSTFVPAYNADKTAAADAGYVLYLGRICPTKGIDLLVEAVIDRPNIRLKVTGAAEDDFARNLKNKVKDAGAYDRIEFVGFVKGAEKDALIDGSSCVACPSTWYENMPNTVLEACAHGKPVVVFDVGCMAEIVEDGVTGAVVALRDVDALGEAVERYFLDPELAKRHGANARNLANDKYTSKRHLDMLLDVLAPQPKDGANNLEKYAK